MYLRCQKFDIFLLKGTVIGLDYNFIERTWQATSVKQGESAACKRVLHYSPCSYHLIMQVAIFSYEYNKRSDAIFDARIHNFVIVMERCFSSHYPNVGYPFFLSPNEIEEQQWSSLLPFWLQSAQFS